MSAPRRERRGRRSSAPEFIVVTGLSGAGKSHAIRALEDQGFLCVDNLPIALVETFADLSMTATESRRAAVVIDIREGQGLEKFPAIYRSLKKRFGAGLSLIFLEADTEAIRRRFSETRRPHPLGSLTEGIQQEKRVLQPIRRLADTVIDTTGLNVHDLRHRVFEATGAPGPARPLTVTLLSFGFRRGVPADADLVFDVRFLPNPHFVRTLRPWSGRHAKVSQYVLRSRPAKTFMRLTGDLLKFLLPQYIAEGKTYLTIAIGCTGGRHRSVAIAQALADRLEAMSGIELKVRHRDIDAH